MAIGKYILYLDDNEFLADPQILESIPNFEQPWAIFPITRLGQRFFPDLTEISKTNLIIKREHAQWTDTSGTFVQGLLGKYPYASFPDFKPIAITGAKYASK